MVKFLGKVLLRCKYWPTTVYSSSQKHDFHNAELLFCIPGKVSKDGIPEWTCTIELLINTQKFILIYIFIVLLPIKWVKLIIGSALGATIAIKFQVFVQDWRWQAVLDSDLLHVYVIIDSSRQVMLFLRPSEELHMSGWLVNYMCSSFYTLLSAIVLRFSAMLSFDLSS